MGKKFFTVRVVAQGRCGCAIPERAQGQAEALNNLAQRKESVPTAEGWERDALRGPVRSHPIPRSRSNTAFPGAAPLSFHTALFIFHTRREGRPGPASTVAPPI